MPTFPLLDLAQELRDNIFSQAVSDEIPLTFPATDQSIKGLFPINVHRHEKVIPTYPDDFQSINGFLSTSKDIRFQAQKAILRTTEEKTTIIIDARIPDPVVADDGYTSDALPLMFYEGACKLKLILPATFIPRLDPNSDSRYIGHLELTMVRKFVQGLSTDWEHKQSKWVTTLNGSANQNEADAFKSLIPAFQQYSKDKALVMLGNRNLTSGGLIHLRSRFLQFRFGESFDRSDPQMRFSWAKLASELDMDGDHDGGLTADEIERAAREGFVQVFDEKGE